MKHVCHSCGDSKPADEFGITPRKQSGRDYRCKLCIAEQAKLSIRTRKLIPALRRRIKKWPVRSLNSEIDYLIAKLDVIAKERDSR